MGRGKNSLESVTVRQNVDFEIAVVEVSDCSYSYIVTSNRPSRWKDTIIFGSICGYFASRFSMRSHESIL